MDAPTLSPAMHRDAFLLLAGRELGHGTARQVFVCDLDPTLVVKVEPDGCSFQNIIERETWERVKDTDMAKWFAPVHSISPNGSVMLMHRTQPGGPKDFPDLMPKFLGDFKRTNYGMLKGKLVCHDYGTNMLFEFGLTKRMQKVRWWNAQS